MSQHNMYSNRDFSKFDHMSTEALEEILRQDSYLPEDEESDIDAILYITEVITRREKEQATGKYADANDAWKSFNKNYRPYLDDDKPLFDDEDNCCDTITNLSVDIEPKTFKACNNPRQRRKSGFLRKSCIAAAILALLFVCSITSYALGYDLWGAVAIWTKETFSFSASGDKAQDNRMTAEVPEQLEKLELLMSEYPLPKNLLPTYLPDGYEEVETSCDPQASFVDFYCALENGNGFMSIEYRMYTGDNYAIEYEKDTGNPEIYEKDGTTYYIMTNYGTFYAVWMSANVECGIYGITSREELMKTINSINGG